MIFIKGIPATGDTVLGSATGSGIKGSMKMEQQVEYQDGLMIITRH